MPKVGVVVRDCEKDGSCIVLVNGKNKITYLPITDITKGDSVKMSEKQGLFEQEIIKIFARNNITAHDIGIVCVTLLAADQQVKIFHLIEDAKADFPYKIYEDNEGFGENPKPTFSFYPQNPKDPDKSFPIEDLLEVESKVALWLQKWFCETKTGKPSSEAAAPQS